ncbi:MAG: DUF448 domain-containing protein [Alphaproteobacteria bacterium]|nr:DUF448 domain-containing protein [Alphaproteobacteria bacterium]TAD91872.1 MAG: DUF448 domain-containing protein [Alphaproteobacteria bacterium]
MAADPADLPADDEDDHRDDHGPVRRCVVSSERLPVAALLRLTVAPDGEVVPDLDHRLPGRGLYVRADRASVARLTAKGVLARAARRSVTVPPELPERLVTMVRDRALAVIGLARRAGQAVAGYDQVAVALKARRLKLLTQAIDGAEEPRQRFRVQLPGGAIDALTGEELGRPWSRDRLVHVGVTPGGLADRLRIELERLAALRGGDGQDTV